MLPTSRGVQVLRVGRSFQLTFTPSVQSFSVHVLQQMAQQVSLISRSIFLLPPGWDVSSSQGPPPQYLARVVRKVDNAIQRINHYPVINWIAIDPVESGTFGTAEAWLGKALSEWSVVIMNTVYI